MKFFFPDSQDLVDPSFNFQTERRDNSRLRQRDDVYAHEIFSERAYNGLLVSKGIVDGFGNLGSRYTLGQRMRLLREGAPEFFRLKKAKFRPIEIMGDCGAFTYVKEPAPPYSVDDLITFYSECRFDYGMSLDHVILQYRPEWDDPNGEGAPEDVRARQRLTLELAEQFLKTHKKQKLKFVPIGVAQGWSPDSYAASVRDLQSMGYDYIAAGGMVPLKTHEIIASLAAINEVRKPKTKLHLLGVTRTEQISGLAVKYGIASFDSTAPLRQAFKDDKDNYYTPDGAYTAIRIPQIDANPALLRKISSGQVSQDKARKLEAKSLDAMRRFDAGELDVKATVKVLREYEEFYDPKSDHTDDYVRALTDKPWKNCPCEICKALGHHVILFRGAERNRRRGLHNVWVFYRRLQKAVERAASAPEPTIQVPARQMALPTNKPVAEKRRARA